MDYRQEYPRSIYRCKFTSESNFIEHEIATESSSFLSTWGAESAAGFTGGKSAVLVTTAVVEGLVVVTDVDVSVVVGDDVAAALIVVAMAATLSKSPFT
jgi:late competence protein required for DNA uptake (superfamily II DNA/RNA helicase)